MKKYAAVLIALLLLCLGVTALAASNDLTFVKSSYSVFEGETVQLDIVAQGACSGATVKYRSSSAKTASVNSSGLVTGYTKGKVTITASVTVGKKTYKATTTVNVKRAATGVSVSEKKWNVLSADDERLTGLVPEDNTLPVLLLIPGEKLTISASVTPKDASDTRVTVTSDDADVLKIKSETSATAVGSGSSILRIASRSNSDVAREYLVYVVDPVKRISITGESTVFTGSEICLTAEVTPDTATFADVVWSSSNTRIATVDEDGTVHGITRGTVTITASSRDGSGVKGTFRVTVSVAPTSVTIRKGSFYMNVGNSVTLSATVSPSTVSNKNVTWTSSDPSVATVNASGRVTAVGIGSTEITASSRLAEDVYDTVTVTVVQPVTRITGNTSKQSVYVGETFETSWTVQPASASVQDLTFTSSNPKVATVDEDGVVTGIKAGSCTITATAVDGSKKSGKMTVTVIQPVEGVHMRSSSYSTDVDESITITAVLEPSDASNKRMTWTLDDPSIAEIAGTSNKPKVTGLRWGDTTIWGTTQDGGYTCSASLHVGDYNKALKPTDLYLQNNAVKLVVLNQSNLSIARFYFEVELYDLYGSPIACNKKGTNILYGYYSHTLEEGESTAHGRFTFYNYTQPETTIGQLVLRVTSYRTEDGMNYSILPEEQEEYTYTSPAYIGPEPDPEPTEDDDGILTPVFEDGEGSGVTSSGAEG